MPQLREIAKLNPLEDGDGKVTPITTPVIWGGTMMSTTTRNRPWMPYRD
jgi:hypothetical protein